MTLDLDRITHPLRLAKGSHQPGSGKGCAMNVISYINGDTIITDYPECSARPLALMVARLNDRLADQDGFLSPENSVLVLDLGWLTVGTAGVPRKVVWQWLADLLVDPVHGVVKYAKPDGVVAIHRVADLCVREAHGGAVSVTEWVEVRRAADTAAAYAAAAAAIAAAAAAYAADFTVYAAADAAAAAAVAAAAYAADFTVYAAADASIDAAAYATDAVVPLFADASARCLDASAYATDFTRWLIIRWRDLAGLDQPADITPDAVDSALARF